MGLDIPDRDDARYGVAVDIETTGTMGLDIRDRDDARYGVAIDIGTTTVALSLVPLGRDGKPVTVCFINPQREAALGSDVLSRMKNAAEPRIARRMRRMLVEAITAETKRLLEVTRAEGDDGVVTDREDQVDKVLPTGHENQDGTVLSTDREDQVDTSLMAGQAGDAFFKRLPFVVAGNATMLHIFSGLDTASMLTAPFVPKDVSLRHEVLGAAPRQQGEVSCTEDEAGTIPRRQGEAFYTGEGKGAAPCPVTVFPCVSAFVGGDVVAGIYALGLHEKRKPVLFLDLGTNGEMALAVDGKIYVTSVAAGPAFEGGNVSIGMAAVSGAISQVRIQSGFCRVKTVGGAPARGICGSGLFDAVAQMYFDGIIDRHGTFSERYMDDGFPVYMRDATHRLYLTQEDVRAFQTAKAAVAAGAEALLRAGGVAVGDVDEVFLAGSFGEYLNPASAKVVGLLPEALFERVRVAGNTSLRGAQRLLLHPEEEDMVKKIADAAIPLDLAGDDFFKEAFIERMDF